MDVPEEIRADRQGVATIVAPRLELVAKGASPRTLTVPVDDRFQLHLPGAPGADDTWTVTPDDDNGGLVAQLRAANVLDVRRKPSGDYRVDGREFAPPEGFTSLLPGLRLRAVVERKIRVADQALRRSKQTLAATERAGRARSDSERRKASLDAVVAYLEAEHLVALAGKAIDEADTIARQAADQGVPADEAMKLARNKLKVAKRNRDCARGRIEPYLPTFKAEARQRIAKAARRWQQDAGKVAISDEEFKVDRREAVARLAVPRPTRVTRRGGRFEIRTQWSYDINHKRLIRVDLRPNIERRIRAEETIDPGKPLADLVANRDITLRWRDRQWQVANVPLKSFIPTEAMADLPPAPADDKQAATRIIAEGTVLGTLTMPRVLAEFKAGDMLFVGLAVKGRDGQFRIPIGNARWDYELRQNRERPFTVQIAPPTRPEDHAARAIVDKQGRTSESREIRVDPGEVIARQVVNRQTIVVYDRAAHRDNWVEAGQQILLAAPAGFASTFPLPKSDEPHRRTLPNGEDLGELKMPAIKIVLDDGFLVIGMTGSEWSNGQWEYPVGEHRGEATIQIVAAPPLGLATDGAAAVQTRTAEQQQALAAAEQRLVAARERVAQLGTAISDAEYKRGDPATLKRQLEDATAERDDALRAAAPPETVLEIRTSRKATLRYVNQQWTLDGVPVERWFNAVSFERARDRYHESMTRYRNAIMRRDDLRRRLASAPADKKLNTATGEADSAVAKAEALVSRHRMTLERLERFAAFKPLARPGDVLSSDAKQRIVERGTVLARMVAETPHERVRDRDPEATMTTTVTRVGDKLTVAFVHKVPFPARTNVLLAHGAGGDAEAYRVVGNEKLGGYFRSQWIDWDNYGEAWHYVKPFILNTIIVAVFTMVLTLFFGSLAAFVFARFNFPGKAVFYAGIIVLLMIPGVLNLVPMYVEVRLMGLLHQPANLWGRINAILVLVLPAVAGGQVMSVYIMRNNLETLAKDLFDAAKIDGASNFQTYWHIAMPLSRPIMGTLSIFALLSQWNNFIWPWIVIKDKQYQTITAGLALLEGQNLSDFGLQMAGATLASLPLIVLFFFMMNLFIRGIQSGAIKA
jgi:ABC-type glycerol-3-phosphate transport system permease component